MRRIAVMALFTVLGATPAPAQFVTDTATDLELSAGYCVGVLQQDIVLPGTPRKADLQANYQRLWAYLSARGIWTSQRSTITTGGVGIAIKRGRADSLACYGLRGTCIDRCLEKTVDFDHCFGGCFDARCGKVEHCSSKGPILPF